MNRILYNTKYLQLKSTQLKGNKEWVYAHRPNAKNVVIIVPYTDEEILFLIEERPPILAEGKGMFCIGVAAGLVGDEREDESVIEAINSELLEETGLISDKIEVVANNVASSSGCTSETFVVALAHISNKQPTHPPIDDDGVVVGRIWIKHENIFDWLSEKETDGYILTAQSLTGLFYFNRRFL